MPKNRWIQKHGKASGLNVALQKPVDYVELNAPQNTYFWFVDSPM